MKTNKEKSLFENINRDVYKKFKENNFKRNLKVHIYLQIKTGEEYGFDVEVDPFDTEKTSLKIFEEIRKAIKDHPIYDDKVFDEEDCYIIENKQNPSSFERNTNVFTTFNLLEDDINKAFQSENNVKKYKNISQESILDFLENYQEHFFNEFIEIQYYDICETTELTLNEQGKLKNFKF